MTNLPARERLAGPATGSPRLRLPALVLAWLAASPAFGADCVAHSAGERPRLVELYTSEGCSSCPPAEAWLSTLRDDPRWIGLEFHVDYWDELGWPDRFADARYTARQRDIVARGDGRIVYTPQIVVDGRVWKDWPREPAPAATSASGLPLTLAVERADALHVTIDAGSPADAGKYRLYAALAENGLVTAVAAGENRGRRLAHDQVVRAFEGPFDVPHAEAELTPPPDADAANSSVVAFAQETKGGAIVQVVRLPLSQCP